MDRNPSYPAVVVVLVLATLSLAGCSGPQNLLPAGAPLADYQPSHPALPGFEPLRTAPGPPPERVISALHQLADAAAAYADRYAVPGAPDVSLAELADQGYLDPQFSRGHAERFGYRFSGRVGSWGFTIAARGIDPEAGPGCFIDRDRVVCADPACTRPLSDTAERVRNAARGAADPTGSPSVRAAFPAGDTRPDRQRLLDALSEMCAFLSSPRLKGCLVEGALDGRRLNDQLDAVILRHFGSFSASEEASRRWKDDPTVQQAGGDFMKALQKALREHGIRITTSGKPPEGR